MKYEKKRITKIVDEIVTYLFSIGGTDIKVHISQTELLYKIFFESNFKEGQEKKIKNLIKYLSGPKQAEVEEYYWELSGESNGNLDTEISLVAAMVDKAEIDVQNSTILITLLRKVV